MPAIILLCIAMSARAEIWAPLEDYVALCTSIVKAKTVAIANGQVEFEITEVWLGSDERKRYVTYDGEHGVHVEVGQEIIFFFTERERHGTAFPIKDGRLIYGATSDSEYREYTVDEFRDAITAIGSRTTP